MGLYRQGLLHDLSKYGWTEFHIGCKYYQGNRSPNNAERETKGYSSAWLHHKGRNKHHYEYWIDYAPKGGKAMTGMRMPVNYVVEMFLDRIAASKVYQGAAYTDVSPLQYYLQGGTEGYMMHKKTQALLEKLLYMLADEGEEKTYRYIRRMLKAYRKYRRTRNYSG